jgi:hypothetical protein
VVIDKIYVGTFSNPLTSLADLPSGDPDPATNPGLVSRGNKYVVKVSFDTDDIVAVTAASRLFQTRDFQSVALGDAPGGGGNTYELFIPSEGYGGILTQTGQDHFTIGGGSATTAEIHFFSNCTSEATCDAAFRGFEFESNYLRTNSPSTPHASGDLVFEQRDPDAMFGTTVTNNVVNMLDGALNGIMFNGGHVDVRSEDASPSGGQANPGVFFGEAVPVVAEAGASPIAFDAVNLTRTTDGGTELLTDTVVPPSAGTLRSAPSALDDATRQGDNDLGAGRADGEDFLTYAWTADGAVLAGNQTGTRLDRKVESGIGGSRFVNDPTDRTVDDVNVAVGIAASGLQTTIDTTSWSVAVTEAITGFSDTDSITISYNNALPVIDAALATPAGPTGAAVKFQLDFHDADEDAVNALIANFELLEVEIFFGLVDKTALFASLIATGMQTLGHATLLSEFGVGMHSLKVLLTDRFLRDTSGMLMDSIDFEVLVPEPGVAWLGLVGLLGLGAAGRRRR